MPNLFKTSRISTLWRHHFLIKWSMTLKVIQGDIRHLYVKIILAHSLMDRFWWKFIWIHFYVMEKLFDSFTLRPSDLNTTLTFVLMDNFCSCLFLFLYLVQWRKTYLFPFTTLNIFSKIKETNLYKLKSLDIILLCVIC